MLPGNQTARLLSADRPGCAEDHARARRRKRGAPRGKGAQKGHEEGVAGNDGVGLVAKGAGGAPPRAHSPQARGAHNEGCADRRADATLGKSAARWVTRPEPRVRRGLRRLSDRSPEGAREEK